MDKEDYDEKKSYVYSFKFWIIDDVNFMFYGNRNSKREIIIN